MPCMLFALHAHTFHLWSPGCSAQEDTSGGTSICSYAKIATLAQQDLCGLEEMWDPQDLCSHVIMSGTVLITRPHT